MERSLEAGRAQRAEIERKADGLAREITVLKTESVVAARAVQDHEERLGEIGARLDALRARAAERRAALERRRAQIAALLAALERVALRPPEALVALPVPPVDAVRGAILLRAALPPLEARARGLARELDEIARLGAEIAERRAELEAETRALAEKRAALDGLIARKRALTEELRADSAARGRELERLAREAEDLRGLLARLEVARARALPKALEAKPESPRGVETAALPRPRPQERRAARPFGQARGSLIMPARGRLVRRYGEPGETGMPSQGIAVETPPGARIVAPYDGEVVFAGPFRGYGRLLIIAHGEGYHLLLAGLSRIDCVVGQWLLAGEPVGVMGPSEDGSPHLYVELRHEGDPINPLPWMAARDEKVSG